MGWGWECVESTPQVHQTTTDPEDREKVRMEDGKGWMRPEGERGARAPQATVLASGRAPLVLLQTLRELDQAIDSPTEKQWSCGDAIARLRAFVWKAFSENAIRPRAN